MAIEFSIVLVDAPGSLPHLAAVLGEAGVNIEAIGGTTREGVVRFVPDRPDHARRALDSAGLPYTEREVLVVRVLDEPGALGQVTLVMSRAGINIDSVYVTTKGYLVLGVDDLPGATHVAAGMAVMIGQ